MATGMTPQNNFIIHYSNRFRCHNFISISVFQHSILMDTGLMGKCIFTNNSLVRLYKHPRKTRNHSAGIVNFFCIDICMKIPKIGTDIQRHNKFFHTGITGTFTNSIDGTFNLPGTISNSKK